MEEGKNKNLIIFREPSLYVGERERLGAAYGESDACFRLLLTAPEFWGWVVFPGNIT